MREHFLSERVKQLARRAITRLGLAATLLTAGCSIVGPFDEIAKQDQEERLAGAKEAAISSYESIVRSATINPRVADGCGPEVSADKYFSIEGAARASLERLDVPQVDGRYSDAQEIAVVEGAKVLNDQRPPQIGDGSKYQVCPDQAVTMAAEQTGKLVDRFTLGGKVYTVRLATSRS